MNTNQNQNSNRFNTFECKTIFIVTDFDVKQKIIFVLSKYLITTDYESFFFNSFVICPNSLQFSCDFIWNNGTEILFFDKL